MHLKVDEYTLLGVTIRSELNKGQCRDHPEFCTFREICGCKIKAVKSKGSPHKKVTYPFISSERLQQLLENSDTLQSGNSVAPPAHIPSDNKTTVERYFSSLESIAALA